MMPVNFSTCCLIRVLCLLLHLLLSSVAQDETCYEKAIDGSEGFTNDITVNIVCLQNGSIEIGWKFDALQYDFFQVEYQCDDEGDIDDDIDWGNNVVWGLAPMDAANVTIVLLESDYRYCVITGCAYHSERGGPYKHYYVQPSYCMVSHGNSILDEQSSAMMSSSVMSVAIVSSAFLASIGGSSSSTSTVPITSHMHTATSHSLTDGQSTAMMSVAVASSASTRASSSTVAITSSATHIHTASHSPTEMVNATISTSIAAGPAPSIIMPEYLIISVAIITALLFISLIVILSLCLRFRKRRRDNTTIEIIHDTPILTSHITGKKCVPGSHSIVTLCDSFKQSPGEQEPGGSSTKVESDISLEILNTSTPDDIASSGEFSMANEDTYIATRHITQRSMSPNDEGYITIDVASL